MRYHMIRSALPLAALAMLAGCEHAENYRWSVESAPKFPTSLNAPTTPKFGSWSGPAVTVYSYATPPASTSDAGLRDLSDRGQAAYIEALTKPGITADDIRDLLAKPIKANPASQVVPVTIEGTYKRTLVANVTKGWSAKPGDRLVWTWIYVEPVNFVFDGYTVAATATQVLNIEQVTNATTASLTGQLGKTSSDTSSSTTAGTPTSSALSNVLGASAGISGNVGNTYTTTASINQQYLPLGVDVVPEGLRIYRESERNLDVAGNTLISLTMRIDPNRLEDAGFTKTLRVTALELLDKENAMLAPGAVTMKVTVNKAPPRCDLRARVTLYYQIRKVQDGRSYMEGEQDAEYYSEQSTPQETVLVPANEITSRTWAVYSPTNKEVPLWGRNVFEQPFPLEFTSYEQADAFAAWLDAHASDFYGKDKVAVGKSGLSVWSGVLGQPIDGGTYTARPYAAAPQSLAAQCAKILGAGLRPVVMPAPVGPPPPLPKGGQ